LPHRTFVSRERRRVRSFHVRNAALLLLLLLLVETVAARRRRRCSGVEHFDRSVGRARRHSL